MVMSFMTVKLVQSQQKRIIGMNQPHNIFIDGGDACERKIMQNRIELRIETESFAIVRLIQNITSLNALLRHYNTRLISTTANREKYDNVLQLQSFDGGKKFHLTIGQLEFAKLHCVPIYTHTSSWTTCFWVNCDSIDSTITDLCGSYGKGKLSCELKRIRSEPHDLPSEDWFLFAHYYAIDAIARQLQKLQIELTDYKDRKQKLVKILTWVNNDKTPLMDTMADVMATDCYINDDIIAACLFDAPYQAHNAEKTLHK